MTILDRIEHLLVDLVRDGLVDLDQPRKGGVAGVYSRRVDGQPVTIELTDEGRSLLSEMVNAIHSDKTIARNLRRSEIEDDVIHTAVQAAYNADRGALDAAALAAELWDSVNSGRLEWSVVLPVSGLSMPEGRSVEIAGLSIGPLTDERSALIRSAVDEIGQTSRIGQDGAPGSALPTIREHASQTLASSPCWAIGTIVAREVAADRLAAEQIKIALSVLRTFSMHVGIDPDSSALGLPQIDGRTSSLRYRAVTVPSPRLKISFGRHSVRWPFDLGEARLQRLVDYGPFRRAQEIVASPCCSEVEHKIVLGMMQFADTSSLDPVEPKLQGYLTVIEAILAKEDSEYRDRATRAVRRLSLFFSPESRQQVRDELRALYDVRRLPVHYGQRTLGGYEVVSKAMVEQARLYAYYSILLGLGRSVGSPSHDAFIDALDADLRDESSP